LKTVEQIDKVLFHFPYRQIPVLVLSDDMNPGATKFTLRGRLRECRQGVGSD